MAIPNRKSWVSRLAVCNLLVGAGALAQEVSFLAQRDFDAGNSPRPVAVGDFNGDGVQDLAIANQWSNNVSVLLGIGDGRLDFGVTNRDSNNVSILINSTP